MRNKLFLTVLTACMLLALLAGTAMGATFSDLKGHWSEDYMQDMADRGLFNGYPDGTIGPDKQITACETLVVLSRIYDLSDEQIEFIEEDYGSVVKKYAPASLAWAYDELAICLAADILSTDELAKLTLGGAIEKELITTFLARALNMEEAGSKLYDDALITATSDGTAVCDVLLDFDDANTITEDYLGGIAMLVKHGIITGDNHNRFNPEQSVTRCIFAAMTSRGLDYLEKNNVSRKLEAYENMSRTEGVITAVSNSTVQITTFSGLTVEYRLNNDTAIKVNGTDSKLAAGHIGCRVVVNAKENKAVLVNITATVGSKWEQAVLHNAYTNNMAKYLQTYPLPLVKDADKVRYNFLDTTVFEKAGKEIDIAELNVYDFLTIEVKDGVAHTVIAAESDQKIVGTVTSLDFDSTVTMKVKDDTGMVYVFAFSLSDLPSVKRGTIDMTVDQLAVDDSITVEIENGQVKTITVAGEATTVTGTISEISTTVNGTKWTIQTANGKSVTYTLEKNAVIKQDGKVIKASAVVAGTDVELVLYGNSITEAKIVAAASTSTKIEGEVLSADGSTRELILKIDNKLIYVKGSTANSIIDSETGKGTTVSKIKAGDTVVVYGFYTDSNHFQATSIIVE